MKKSLTHSGLVFILTLILTGCGGGNNAASGSNEFGEPARFKISDTTWRTSIPLDWEAPPTKPSGTILVAQNQDQNFILVQKPGFSETLKADLLANTANVFFDFMLQSEGNNSWSFRGKLTVDDPMRVFHQKVLPVPGTDSYLIGICSYDYWEGRPEVCSQILDQWVQEEVTNN